MQKPNEKPEIGEGINDFIQNHRRPIVISAVVIALLLIVSIAAFSLMDVFRKKAISDVEGFSDRYESLQSSINEEYSSNDVAELLADLEPFAQRTSGFAGGKAWSIVGGIYSAREEWAEAEAAWVKAAEKTAKNYLAPLALFNAGVAAEQQGKYEQAIDYYAQSISAPAGFSSAPRAQFSIGRLRETLNDKDAAIAAYRAVISLWPNEGVWANLARSRIIALELQ